MGDKNKCAIGGSHPGSSGDPNRDETFKGCPANCYECYTDTRECVECGYGYLLNEKSVCERKTCKEDYCLKCYGKSNKHRHREGWCYECEYPKYVVDGTC